MRFCIPASKNSSTGTKSQLARISLCFMTFQSFELRRMEYFYALWSYIWYSIFLFLCTESEIFKYLEINMETSFISSNRGMACSFKTVSKFRMHFKYSSAPFDWRFSFCLLNRIFQTSWSSWLYFLHCFLENSLLQFHRKTLLSVSYMVPFINQ